jgi:hypothetical protein
LNDLLFETVESHYLNDLLFEIVELHYSNDLLFEIVESNYSNDICTYFSQRVLLKCQCETSSQVKKTFDDEILLGKLDVNKNGLKKMFHQSFSRPQKIKLLESV